jgi:hypothetical protein
MLSKLQTRLPQLPTLSLPRPQSTEVSRKPSLDRAVPPNPALRTLRGDSLFELPNTRPSAGLGPVLSGGIGDKLFPSIQKAAVDRALGNNGLPVPFVNSDGKTEPVSLRHSPYGEGDTYTVSVGGDTFTVHFEEGSTADQQAALAQIIDSYSETPPELRGSLERVEVKAEPHPDGAAATAGNGTITFYDGVKNLTEDIFHHEIGHIIGAQEENKADSPLENLGEKLSGGERGAPIPEGWEEAAAADGNHLNEYTEESHAESGEYTEDFAEAWSEYQRAIDQGPEALARFRAQYPARAKLLEELSPPPAA